MYWEQDKNNTVLLTELINHYRRQNDFPALQSLFDEIPASAFTDEILLQQAETYIQAGHLDETDGVLERIKDVEGYYHQLIYLKALKSFFAGDLVQVIELLAEQIEVSLIATKSLYMRALYLNGDVEKALSIQAIIAPEEITPEALGLISLLNLDLENFHIARQQAKGVLKVAPYNVDALIVEASMQVFDQELIDANELLDRCLQVMPHVGRAWSLKGQIAFLSFEFEKAFEYFSQALVYMKDHIGTWHLYAWSCLLKDNISEAKQAFNAALELNNKFGDTYGGLAVIAFVEGELMEAEKLSKKGIRLDKLSASSHYAKSLLEEKAGDEEQAVSRIKKLLSNESHISGCSYIDLVSRILSRKN